MSFKDFRVVETLGKGSFASVYKVIRKSDNKVYALKRVKINKMSKKEISDALNEIRFMASIRQKNIVGFLEAFLENSETELCIVMEYCGCGDLAQKVERYKRRRQYIDEDVIWRYLIQCLKALHCLHERGVCHRDIKVANTFISEDGSIKIGDMNVSKRLKNGHLQTQIGTPYYMSPEIWNNRPYDWSSDMWSLGAMTYELAALKPPFVADSLPLLKKAVTQGKYDSISQKFSGALHRIIAQLLKINPRERPSAEDLLRSSDLAPKLHLDEQPISFGKKSSYNSGDMKLMETIKVPQNLRNLGLPKPCYPDVRPNSPRAWPDFQRKAVLEPMLPHMLPLAPHAEENAIPESGRGAGYYGGGEAERNNNGHAKGREAKQAPLQAPIIDRNAPQQGNKYTEASALPQGRVAGPGGGAPYYPSARGEVASSAAFGFGAGAGGGAGAGAGFDCYRAQREGAAGAGPKRIPHLPPLPVAEAAPTGQYMPGQQALPGQPAGPTAFTPAYPPSSQRSQGYGSNQSHHQQRMWMILAPLDYSRANPDGASERQGGRLMNSFDAVARPGAWPVTRLPR